MGYTRLLNGKSGFLTVVAGISALGTVLLFDSDLSAKQTQGNSQMYVTPSLVVQPELRSVVEHFESSDSYDKISRSELDGNPLVELVLSGRGGKELELAEFQLERIGQLRDAAISEIKRNQTGRNLQRVTSRIIDTYHDNALNVLLPHQQKRLKLFIGLLELKQLGLVDLLVNGSMGMSLELTSRDKEKLRSNSEKMEEFLQKESTKLRKKAVSILVEDLTQVQRNQVFEFVDYWGEESYLDFGMLKKDSLRDCRGCGKDEQNVTIEGIAPSGK